MGTFRRGGEARGRGRPRRPGQPEHREAWQRILDGGVDEAFLVVTFLSLEVVDRWMASPASIEAPVQRGGFNERDWV